MDIENLKKLSEILNISAFANKLGIAPANLQSKIYRNTELNVKEAEAITLLLKIYGLREV
jgi:hypothetical protein